MVFPHLHVLGHGGVGDGRGRRVQAVLAAHAAAVAAEAVHVVEVGVLRARPPHPWVERVLVVDVVVILFPKHQERRNDRRTGEPRSTLYCSIVRMC